MHRVDVDIQNGFLLRRGFMGRWLTAYLHRYSGLREKSERAHNHPWRLAVSFVLRGGYSEVVRGVKKHRRAFSIHWYANSTEHRLLDVAPCTVTLFLGLLRVRRIGPCYQEQTNYGAAHYTELRSVGRADVPEQRPALNHADGY